MPPLSLDTEGTIFDAQDTGFFSGTLDEVISTLNDWGGRGWRGGRTTFVPDDPSDETLYWPAWEVVTHLVDKHGLEGEACVRISDDEDYADGAVECYGAMPNAAIVTAWFYAGREMDIIEDIRREAEFNAQ